MFGSDLGRAAFSEGMRLRPDIPTAESRFEERWLFSRDIEDERLTVRMSGCGVICDETDARERGAFDIQQRCTRKVAGRQALGG